MTIRVLLVDDQEVVRVGFRLILESEPDIHVVGEASDGVQAIELARALLPEVVLMDIRMPRQDGLHATAAILQQPWAQDMRVLVLTTFEQDDYVFEALRAGASGFLLKTTSPEDLVRAVRVIADGGGTAGALGDPPGDRRLHPTDAAHIAPQRRHAHRAGA